MNTLKVIATPGISVPMEDKPRSYITDAEPVTVPDSSYYQRRLSDGDLVAYKAPVPEASVAELPPLADAALADGGKKDKAPKSSASTKTTGETT